MDISVRPHRGKHRRAAVKTGVGALRVEPLGQVPASAAGGVPHAHVVQHRLGPLEMHRFVRVRRMDDQQRRAILLLPRFRDRYVGQNVLFFVGDKKSHSVSWNWNLRSKFQS